MRRPFQLPELRVSAKRVKSVKNWFLSFWSSWIADDQADILVQVARLGSNYLLRYSHHDKTDRSFHFPLFRKPRSATAPWRKLRSAQAFDHSVAMGNVWKSFIMSGVASTDAAAVAATAQAPRVVPSKDNISSTTAVVDPEPLVDLLLQWCLQSYFPRTMKLLRLFVLLAALELPLLWLITESRLWSAILPKQYCTSRICLTILCMYLVQRKGQKTHNSGTEGGETLNHMSTDHATVQKTVEERFLTLISNLFVLFSFQLASMGNNKSLSQAGFEHNLPITEKAFLSRIFSRVRLVLTSRLVHRCIKGRLNSLTFFHQVCSQQWRQTLSVSVKRLQNLRNQMKEKFRNGEPFLCPKEDGRGRHNHRPNRVSDDIRAQINDMMYDVITTRGSPTHYGGRYRRDTIHLPSYLSIPSLWEMFNLIYDDRNPSYMTEVINHREDPNAPVSLQPIITLKWFREFFNKHYGQIRFWAGKTDQCGECARLKAHVDSLKGLPEDVRDNQINTAALELVRYSNSHQQSELLLIYNIC